MCIPHKHQKIVSDSMLSLTENPYLSCDVNVNCINSEMKRDFSFKA